MTDILAGLLQDLEPKVVDGTVLEFSIEKHNLEKALGKAESVVPSKDLIPVLKNFHFKVSGSDLQITASDSVLSVLLHTPVVSVWQEGSAVFPASKLSILVREAPNETINFKVVSKKEKLTATIKVGTTKWVVPLMSPNGYPDLSKVEEFGLVDIPREGFLKAIQKVRKAASTDLMRPYLMLVDVTKGRVRASDSIRFQQAKFDFPFDCQIPTRAAHELVQRLSASNLETFQAGQNDTSLLFRFGNVLFIAQKVVAKFPDVDEVLLKPTLANDLELAVDREALLKAVRRVRITADETTAAVVLSLNTNSVSVESKDRKGGISIETVPATWGYAPRHVSFNHTHLTDMLSSTKSETCVFRLGKDLKTRPTPLLMEDLEEGFIAVLSQIRLDWM